MALQDDVRSRASEQTGLMDKKLFYDSFPTGIAVMPADAMIRGAASASLTSDVLRWSLAMIGASIRIVLLSVIAVGLLCVVAVVYLADVRDTSRRRSQRRAARGTSRRAHASVRRHVLPLSSF